MQATRAICPTLPVLAIAATLVLGCTSGLARSGWRDSLAREVAARGLDPQPVLEPFVLTSAMQSWAQAAVEGFVGDEEQVRALLRRMIEPSELQLTYVWGHTGTAAEVFEQRQANCLAFTNLFISMARYLGLEVGFLLVRDTETFRKEGDLVVISDHVAAGFGHGPSRLVIDLAQEPHRGARRMEVISDLTALGLFYSNRGAEALQANDPDAARGWLQSAIALAPERSGAWVNYGVALRRSHLEVEAEAAYRQALEIDPRATSAATNLAALLRRVGRGDEARAIEVALGEQPGRNPFTYLALADVSRASGHLEEASRLYRRAISLNRDDAEAYAALGLLAVQAGDQKVAKRLLRRARQRDPDHPRTLLLADQLRRSGPS